MDYGDGSYASHLSEFLEGLDEPVNNWFRWYSVFTLEKNPKAHVKTLQQDLKKIINQPWNKKQKVSNRFQSIENYLDVRSAFTKQEWLL